MNLPSSPFEYNIFPRQSANHERLATGARETVFLQRFEIGFDLAAGLAETKRVKAFLLKNYR